MDNGPWGRRGTWHAVARDRSSHKTMIPKKIRPTSSSSSTTGLSSSTSKGPVQKQSRFTMKRNVTSTSTSASSAMDNDIATKPSEVDSNAHLQRNAGRPRGSTTKKLVSPSSQTSESTLSVLSLTTSAGRKTAKAFQQLRKT